MHYDRLALQPCQFTFCRCFDNNSFEEHKKVQSAKEWCWKILSSIIIKVLVSGIKISKIAKLFYVNE